MKILDTLISLVYPPRCAVCMELLEMGSDGSLCIDCAKKFENNKGITVKYLGDMRIKNTHHLSRGYAVFEYKDIKRAIEHFKFKGFKNDGIALGQIMFDVAQQNFPFILQEADLLVPVPVHLKRLKERGFNQSLILTQRIASLSQIDCQDAIKRIRYTVPQSGLQSKQRLENIKDAFEIEASADIKGKKIIIIDDIFTTGATMNECAGVLRKSGAKQVDFFALSVALL